MPRLNGWPIFMRSFLKTTLPWLLIIAGFVVGMIFLVEYATRKAPPEERAAPPIPRPLTCGIQGLDLVRLSDGLIVCTHGGDPDPPPRSAEATLLCLPVVGCPQPSPTPTRSPSTAFACTNSTVPKGIQLVYGHPSDRPDAFSEWAPTIQQIAARMDSELRGRRVRWVCDTSGRPQIRRVTLAPVSDGSYTFREYMDGVRGRSWGQSSDRAYLGFVSGIASEYPYGGQATLWDDDRNAVNNVNNSGPMYSMVDTKTWTGALHELGHNLGAVQCSAPHSTCAGRRGAHHCWDENDIMCYNDGYGAMTTYCRVSPPLFDCRNDDYYNIAPASGSYLATHWNLARSAFLARE